MSSDKLLSVSSSRDEKLEDLSSDIRCIEFAIFNIHLLVNPTHVREYLKLGPCTELDRGLDNRLQKTTSFLNNEN